MTAISAALFLSLAAPAPAPVPTAAGFDVSRYLGTWYELARFPQFFEKGCVGVTATYTKKPDGELAVRNVCRKETLDGKVSDVNGTAWVPDPREPAKLKVSFFWPFRSDYWVIAVADDYAWAIVGDGKRSTLWILSRKPVVDEKLYGELVEKAKAAGFDVGKLERVLQKAEG